jgi:hypothetical protein
MSAGEDLFYGLCRWWGIQINRSAEIADFFLPGKTGLYVIIDDTPDHPRDDDAEFLRERDAPLVVLDAAKLNVLRNRGREDMARALDQWRHDQQHAVPKIR